MYLNGLNSVMFSESFAKGPEKWNNSEKISIKVQKVSQFKLFFSSMTNIIIFFFSEWMHIKHFICIHRGKTLVKSSKTNNQFAQEDRNTYINLK